MILTTVFASSLALLPASLQSVDIWSQPPCRPRSDAPGIMSGYRFKTGIYDCAFLLSDPNAAKPTIFIYEFRPSGLAPSASDLETAVTPSLTLIGPVASYRTPRFEGNAQFILMPQWKDTAAQDAALMGYDWAVAPGSTQNVKCIKTQKTTLCRAIVRNDERLFVHATFAPGKEPVDTTYAALVAFAADF
ncbi:MAG: hypothetical protein QM698_02530 [Micropepsaceae bacterium]